MTDTTFSLQQARTMLSISKATSFRWLKSFSKYLEQAGARKQGRAGWQFNRESLELLARIQHLSNEGKSYDEIEQELKSLSGLKESHEVSPESTALTTLESHLRQVSSHYQREMTRLESHCETLANQMETMRLMIHTQQERVTDNEEVIHTLKGEIARLSRPWYSKFWSWMNQPITWNDKEIDIIFESHTEKTSKKESGMRRITESRAA